MERSYEISQQHFELFDGRKWVPFGQEPFRFVCRDEVGNIDLFPPTSTALMYVAQIINTGYAGRYSTFSEGKMVVDVLDRMRIVTKPLDECDKGMLEDYLRS